LHRAGRRRAYCRAAAKLLNLRPEFGLSWI
jgi:hypothetical protein